MLLLLNAHDGVDCLRSLLSSWLTEHRSEKALSDRSKKELTPEKDTSPPDQRIGTLRNSQVLSVRTRGEEQSNRNPTPQKMRHPAHLAGASLTYQRPHYTTSSLIGPHYKVQLDHRINHNKLSQIIITDIINIPSYKRY